jgi:hypothetical protein
MRLVMDPLGMVAEVVELESLKRWDQIPPVHHLTDYSAIGEEQKHATSPFPFDPVINSKIALWYVLIKSLFEVTFVPLRSSRIKFRVI